MKLPASAVERVVRDFADVDLGDERRDRRARAIVTNLAHDPSASLPELLGSDAAVQGCYRLVNNREVTMDALLSPHVCATAARASDASVLVVHDTTECAFADLEPEEIGYLQTGQAGFKLHLALVLDTRAWRRPLGVIHAESLHRAKPTKRTAKRRPSGTDTARMNDRESDRWWRGMRAATDALSMSAKVIHIADREGDSYDLLAKLTEGELRFVIRVRVDRRASPLAAAGEPWSTVKALAASCEGVVEREVQLSKRHAKATPAMTGAHLPRNARRARLRFAAMPIAIPRPQYLSAPTPSRLALNLVHVKEVDVPDSEPAVEWLLYTTEPIDKAEHVCSIIDAYRARWTIEELNAALKTGCAYEERHFESKHALLGTLALSLPVACEVLALRSYARASENAPATDVLTAQQLQVLAAFASRPLGAAPTVIEALLAVAALGGHLRRNGPPGWRVLQRGMTRLLDYEIGWAAARASLAAGAS